MHKLKLFDCDTLFPIICKEAGEMVIALWNIILQYSTQIKWQILINNVMKKWKRLLVEISDWEVLKSVFSLCNNASFSKRNLAKVVSFKVWQDRADLIPGIGTLQDILHPSPPLVNFTGRIIPEKCIPPPQKAAETFTIEMNRGVHYPLAWIFNN